LSGCELCCLGPAPYPPCTAGDAGAAGRSIYGGLGSASTGIAAPTTAACVRAVAVASDDAPGWSLIRIVGSCLDASVPLTEILLQR
jgi:hypothetical protein